MPRANLISLNESTPEEAAEQARAALVQGGIVAFPTETVYGLAIRGGDAEVNERLYALKGRDPSQKLARYVMEPNQVYNSDFPAGLRAKKLISAFWPGPLTLVLEKPDQTTMGFRCSSHPVAALLGKDKDLEVYGTSANLSGDPPMTEMTAIMDQFGDQLELGIDHGGALEGRATTVILLPHSGGYKILRAGELDNDVIKAELELHICFVCTGNTCRSPLAEAMFRDLLSKREIGGALPIKIHVSSAGTSAGYGAPPSPNSVQVAAERGLDLSHHVSQPVAQTAMEQCDLIVTLTAAHRDLLVSVLPQCEDRIRTLGGAEDISDPYGGDLATYEACAKEIERHLNSLLEEL